MWISWFTACIAMANSLNMAGAMQIHRNTETERDSIQEHNAWNIVINTQRNQNLTLFFSVPLLADLLHLCLIVLNIPEMEHTSLNRLNIEKKGSGNVSAALFVLEVQKFLLLTSCSPAINPAPVSCRPGQAQLLCSNTLQPYTGPSCRDCCVECMLLVPCRWQR